VRLEDLLRRSARRLPGKTALVAGKRRLGFTELDVMSDRLAAALVRRGIVRGDRVALFMANSFEAVVAIIALLKAGAVLAPVDPAAKSDKLALVLNDCRAAAIITQARLAGTAAAALARADSVRIVVVAGGGAAPAAAGCLSFEEAVTTTGNAPAEPGDAGDPAMIFYGAQLPGSLTGVLSTHASMIERVATYQLESSADDLILGTLPLSSEQGLYQVLTALAAGATVVLDQPFATPEMIGTIGHYRVGAEAMEAAL